MSYADASKIEGHIAEVVPLTRPGPRVVTADEAEYEAWEAERLRGDQQISSAPSGPEEVPEHLLEVPGLVGTIQRWITKTAPYPQPLLALGAALVLVGTAAGRKFAGPTKSGTHLYILGLADTGAGKNHPAKMAKRILRAADMAEFNGPPIFMSDTSVYQYVAAQPQMLCVMDEFGSYLQKINSPKGGGYEKAISGVLRTLWGSSFDTVYPPAWASGGSRDKTPPIQSPSLSIFGMSVHDEFYAALQSVDIANGFLNRFLILGTHHKPPEVDDPLSDDEVPEKYIIEPLQAIAATGFDVKRAGKTPSPTGSTGWTAEVRVDWECADARLSYKAFRKNLEERSADAKLLSRVPEMAVRLATIRAIGQGKLLGPKISVADITWACELAMWSAERMISDANLYMVESDHQGRANEVLRHIKAAKGGRLSHTELNRKVRHKYDARQLKLILDGLTDAGQIDVVRVQAEGLGRPTDFIIFKG